MQVKILAESYCTLQPDLVGLLDRPRYRYLCPDREDQAIASLEAFYGSRLSDMVRRQFIQGGWAYLGDLAAQAAGDDRIVFHGPVSHTETLGFYHRAAMLVFPLIWNEPSGLPQIEAAACRLPVVSTYSGGIPEYVQHGRTGIFTARGDVRELALVIAKVLDDPALARALGEAGRQRMMERFTWDRISRHLADLIESVSPAHGSQKVSVN